MAERNKNIVVIKPERHGAQGQEAKTESLLVWHSVSLNVVL